MELDHNYMAVTNNEAFYNKHVPNLDIELLSGFDIKDVFEKVRDYVHIGHRVLSHPLSGSVKPNETPIKTVFLTKTPGKGGQVDIESLKLIENAILSYNKFVKRNFDYTNSKNDFETVDMVLAESALISIRGY